MLIIKSKNNAWSANCPKLEVMLASSEKERAVNKVSNKKIPRIGKKEYQSYSSIIKRRLCQRYECIIEKIEFLLLFEPNL